MSNELTPKLLSEIFSQESADVFLMLVTITHPEFTEVIRLVNNNENVTSRGIEYQCFPMEITLPTDDGESERKVTIEFDNVSLALLGELRTVITPMDIKIELILTSDPDIVQMAFEDLKMRSVSYDQQRIRAQLYMDSFLNVELDAERYTPHNFPGIF